MKKWIKILLVTLGIIAVLVVTTILLLPPIAKNYLEKHSKELVGRQITIEKLRFNVLNGKLRIDRIAMLEPDDSTTFASLGNFYTRIHLLPLLRQRIHIDAVLIDKPYLNVYQDGTSFNFDDLLNRFLTPADTVEKAPSNPWTVDIDDIKIHNGELTYKDMQRNVTWGFKSSTSTYRDCTSPDTNGRTWASCSTSHGAVRSAPRWNTTRRRPTTTSACCFRTSRWQARRPISIR